MFILCVVHDGVEPVSDGEDCAVLELRADGGLDEIISLQVNSSCGFIEDEDSGLPQQGSGQTHELPLSHTAHTRDS